MTSIIPRVQSPERLMNFVLGYNSVLEIGAGFLFMFRPTIVYDKPSHEVAQVSGFLANALFCIGALSAVALYLNVPMRTKRAMSMALFVYHALLSWMLMRVVFLERKTFDPAAMSMTSHIIGTILLGLVLFRTQNIGDLPRIAEKISDKISSMQTESQKEA